MSKRCLILISDDLSLQSYFQTTLQVIGLSCQIIDNKNNLPSQTGDGEVVFFDPNRFCSMDGLFSRWDGLSRERSPVFILLAESFSSLPDGFQFAIQRDLDRKELCRLLDTLEVSYSKDPDSSLWYQTVVPAKMEDFLKNLREKKLEIEPVYRNGDFHYPVVEHFFAGDQDDALYLLHDLVARNILKKGFLIKSIVVRNVTLPRSISGKHVRNAGGSNFRRLKCFIIFHADMSESRRIFRWRIPMSCAARSVPGFCGTSDWIMKN